MLLLALALSCAGPPPPAEPPRFLRGAVLLDHAVPGSRALTQGRHLLPTPWRPGQPVEVLGQAVQAPLRAECVALFHVGLGDVSRLIAMGGSAPDTALAFSPDGTRLAVGTARGELLVLDAWTGEELARRTLAEAVVKSVVWSPDGGTLYAGEQSPDAMLYAFDADLRRIRWSLRLSDSIGRSPAPAGEDLFGVYSLPAVFALRVLSGGDVLVAAAHGWTDGGVRRNQAQLLRLSPEGERVAVWPAQPADAVFVAVAVDEVGQLAAVALTRSADGPAPADLPMDGVQVLDLDDLSPQGAHQVAPLEPWFKRVFIWEAVDVSAGADALLMGLGDGRVFTRHLDGRPGLELSGGAPVLAGEVPVAASVGHGFLHGDTVVYLTSGTNIPYGAAAPDLRPPSAHPAENTLRVVGPDGQERWSYTGAHRLEGLTPSADRRTLVVGAGLRVADTREDLFGALVFDLGMPGFPDDRGGDERLSAVCATESPVFFRQAISGDGRVAVAEHPWVDSAGAVRGAYQVTVLR